MVRKKATLFIYFSKIVIQENKKLMILMFIIIMSFIMWLLKFVKFAFNDIFGQPQEPNIISCMNQAHCPVFFFFLKPSSFEISQC
mmetsp:Transcript_21689/g.32745  ORF Transcript_21689/g.32745 Transcript_21689/m.32745 type:complete len:85 (-) Transcript_21689:391-645(-)